MYRQVDLENKVFGVLFIKYSDIQIRKMLRSKGMQQIELNSNIGVVCCSNGWKNTHKNKIDELDNLLRVIGLLPVHSNCIYASDNLHSGTAKERANALMKFYEDDSIKAIFDISGGDLANGVLPYLNYDIIRNSDKLFWGYSDLTTVVNAIYAKTGKSSVLYQVRNLLYEYKEQQIADFQNTVIKGKEDLFHLDYEFVQKKAMQGIVVGGNIRCFLKLAGTEYMPDLTDKILLLESYSGTVSKMETYLWQLQQLGAFEKIAGILLGTFTQMEEEQCSPDIVTLVKEVAGKEIPIAVTKQIGHGTNSKAIMIGKEMKFYGE